MARHVHRSCPRNCTARRRTNRTSYRQRSIGPGTQLFRANLRGGVTIGPECRIGGEIEEAIIHGHTNKYHEGFLGHSYVGEWVNLGALTSSVCALRSACPQSVGAWRKRRRGATVSSQKWRAWRKAR